jgi:hypothetical protein
MRWQKMSLRKKLAIVSGGFLALILTVGAIGRTTLEDDYLSRMTMTKSGGRTIVTGINNITIGAATPSSAKFTTVGLGVVNYINDTTPDASVGGIIEVGSNTGTTTVTDLDNPVVGSIVILVTKGGANYSTITDGGNFAIAGNWSPNSADDTLSLYVQADNDYIEIGRTNN